MTSDGQTQLKVSLTYTGADARYSISAHDIKFYWYNGSDLFNDDSKELITDTDLFVGKYTSDNTEKESSVTITAPAKFPFTSYPYYSFYVVIKVKFKNGGTASVAKNIGISRPGVLILHGLNDSSSTFQKMKNFLTDSNAFISSQILTKDYSATNTSSFYANTHSNQVVRIGLHELSNQLYEAGIASTKYDMVGHSMGGILERLYNQEIDNEHTNKLITLNTPHFGAPLGNVAPTLFNLIDNLPSNIISIFANRFFNPTGGREAVSDLAIGSSAIANLNSSSANRLVGIPVFAVGTYLNTDITSIEEQYISPGLMIEESTYLLAHIFYNDVPRNKYNYLFDDDIWGDGIVSISSQQGGLPSQYYSMFNGSFGNGKAGGAFHCFSPLWFNTLDEIRLLLLSDPDDVVFSINGFGSPSFSRSINQAAVNDITYNESFAEPRPESNITLSANFADDNENVINTNISHSNDMLTTMVFSFLSKDKMVSNYDCTEAKFEIPNEKDSLMVYAIGRTNYNALVVDSILVCKPDNSNILNTLNDKNHPSYRIAGDNLIITSSDSNYFIKIYDATGKLLQYYQRSDTDTYPLDHLHGFLIIEICANQKKNIFKLIN